MEWPIKCGTSRCVRDRVPPRFLARASDGLPSAYFSQKSIGIALIHSIQLLPRPSPIPLPSLPFPYLPFLLSLTIVAALISGLQQ